MGGERVPPVVVVLLVMVVVEDMTRKVGVTRLHLSLDPPFARHAHHPIQLILTSSILIILITLDIHPPPNNIHRKIHFSPPRPVHPTLRRTSTQTHAFEVLLPREVLRP